MANLSEIFNSRELAIIDLLGDNKITISELTKKYYTTRPITIDSNNKISGYLRRITAKCGYHGLNWTIKGEGLGRKGRTVWIQKIIKRRPHVEATPKDISV